MDLWHRYLFKLDTFINLRESIIKDGNLFDTRTFFRFHPFAPDIDFKGKLNHRGNNAYLSSSPGNRILRTRQETIYVSHGTRNDMLFPLSLVELKIIFQHRDTVYISPFYFTYVSRFGSR